MIIKFKKRFLLIFIFLINISNIYSQIVSNVIVSQEEQKVLVKYILSTDLPCRIELFVSKDDGTNWIGPLKKVTGDVGNKINSGNKIIYWKVLEEQESLQGEKIRFKVIASNYKGVQIGNQYWMNENLNVDKFRNGDLIPQAQTDEEWEKAGNNKQPAWCYYNNDSTNDIKYGKLYNWYAVNDPRGLAPEGWHVPSNVEWTTLIELLGGTYNAAQKMKSIGIIDSNNKVINSSGFSAFLSGMRNYAITYRDCKFYSINDKGCWWSISNDNLEYAYSILMLTDTNYNNLEGSIYVATSKKGLGYSVRCIRD